MKNSKYLFILSILLVIFLCFSIFTCTSKSKIQIALVTKFDKASTVGESEILFAKFYLEQNPKSKIKIKFYDDGWDPGKAQTAFNDILKDNIKFIISSDTSTAILAYYDKLVKEDIFCISCGATSTMLTNKDDNLFRIIPDLNYEQKQIANYINSLDGRNLLLIVDTKNKNYTYPSLEYIKQYITNKKIQTLFIDGELFNIETVKKSLSGKKYDICYFIVGSGMVKIGVIAQILYNTNKHCQFIFTPWVISVGIAMTLGSAIDNCTFSSFYQSPDDNKDFDQLINVFKSKFGFSPTITSYKIYEAMQILDRAFSNHCTDPESVKRYFKENPYQKTVLEEIIFNEYGDCISDIYFIKDIEKIIR